MSKDPDADVAVIQFPIWLLRLVGTTIAAVVPLMFWIGVELAQIVDLARANADAIAVLQAANYVPRQELEASFGFRLERMEGSVLRVEAKIDEWIRAR